MKVGLASRNPGKAREIRQILARLPIEIVAPDDTWRAPPEDAPSYEENAVAKARSLAAHLGIPAMADDSGIEVDALGGEPGPRSARFAGEAPSDEENLRALVKALAGTAPGARSARYRCVAVLVSADGAITASAEGTVEGSLLSEPRGTGGFGYDPLFVPAGQTRTMAELDPDEKDRISHRGKAFRVLARALREPAAGA